MSGRQGVVDASVPNRVDAVDAYINVRRAEAVPGEKVLTWTEGNVDSPDPFLQRSAVVDLYFERQRPEAVPQLGRALRSDTVLPEVKRSAIDALEASKSPEAVRPLKEIAENKKVQPTIREEAVKAVEELPGGEQQLRQWSKSKDPIISPAASDVLKGRTK